MNYRSVSNNGADEFSVILGKDFDIRLEKRGTAGYRWTYVFDNEFLELIFDKNEKSTDASTTMGSSSIQSIKFRTIKVGKTKIKFIYKQAWEKEIKEEKEFILNIIKS